MDPVFGPCICSPTVQDAFKDCISQTCDSATEGDKSAFLAIALDMVVCTGEVGVALVYMYRYYVRGVVLV